MNSRVKALALAAGAAACLGLGSVMGAGALARSGDKAQETLAKYEKTGDSVSCLSLHSVRSTDALDDSTMLIEASGGKTYLNELNGRCSGFAREQRYVHRSSMSRMCRGDIIRVINSSGDTMGSCSLGDFEELQEIPPADAAQNE